MAIIDGRLTVCSNFAAASITFDYHANSMTGPSCVVCGGAIRDGRAAAAIDLDNHEAVCQLAADPRHGEALCCHVMHTYCAEYLTESACPGCVEDDSRALTPPAITRIGFDVGGVIVRHREERDLESGVDTAGLMGADYLHAEATVGALDTLAEVVKSLGSENVHIISKCGPETEARTRGWMEFSAFFEKTGIQRKNVHFCRDVKDKAPLVAHANIGAFFECLPYFPSPETWESFAEVDKSKSHQGAAVVLTPAYCDTQITSPVTVNVEVVFGNGRDSKSSEPIEFTYKPSPKLQVQEVEMLPNLPDPADTFLPMEMFNSIGDIVMNSLTHQQTLQPSLPAPVPAPVPVLPQANDEQEDWQALCVLIGELYQNGALSSQHVKDLCEYIKRRDTLLLQAFRSSKTAGTSEQLQANFKQYLSGMLCNL